MKRVLFENRRWVADALHLAVVAAALWASFLLRFEFTPARCTGACC